MALTLGACARAKRLAVIQAAATIYASGNPTMSPRDAVEIAMELEAITAEAFAGIERLKVR